ncbi:MAG TPA: hypothetical protein VLS89_14945 [Candidatus Nanopelagicales bacterium]|nr:hypothetical protein [Candidatus Nanopelagicales bacterium]
MSTHRPPPPPSAPLTLEEYAAVAARILHSGGGTPETVLLQLHISPAAWYAAAEAWERALDDSLGRGDGRLLDVFSSRFIATRAALGRAASARAAHEEPLTGPETVAVSHERVSLPAIPFRSSEPPPPMDDAARRALAHVGLPFVQPSPAAEDDSMTADAPVSPPTLRSPRLIAIPEPPSSVSVRAGPATVRLDIAWSSGTRRTSRPSSEPAPASASSDAPAWAHDALEPGHAYDDEHEIPTPIPLVHVKRRPVQASWLVRIRGWLRRGRA